MSPRFSSFLGRLLLSVVTLSLGLTAQQTSNQATAAPQNPAPASSTYSDEPQPSRVDVFAGYSYLSPNGAINGNKGITKGFTLAGTYWANKYLGAVIETGAHFGDINTFNTVTFGPTFRIPMQGLTPFGLATFGINREAPAGLNASTGFGFTGGGGFDLNATKRLSIRIIEAEYEYGHHNFGFPAGGGTTSLRDNLGAAKISGGLVFHFGTVGPPPIPPSAACSVNPTDVFAGEPVQLTVTPSNFNPKRTLTYNYTATGGKVNGNGATVNVDTAGLNPGSYTVTANVTDGKKGMATCSSNFTIKQPRAPTITCSANPTTVKPGDTSTITCEGKSEDNRPLTYKHESSAGTINANGPQATLNTTGAQPGPITVTSTVSDDRNLSANTQTTVTVEAPPPPPPPPPQASKINQIEFPNKAKPWRVDNTAKAVLDDVALRLQREPDSKLVIVGSQDPTEKRKNLSAERAVDAKFYLTSEKGIDPNRIETRSGGTAGQVAEFWIVPAGATYQGTEPVVDENAIKPIPDHPAPKRATRRGARKTTGAAKPAAH
ncbi:MAG TPA: OmpA family protein [Terriglobales bacterium]|nr:OmpA family protein [Terriglobales bacterium]